VLSVNQALLNSADSVFRVEYNRSLVGVLTVSGQGIAWRAGDSREDAKLHWFDLSKLIRENAGIEEEEMGFAE
jgi:hypothetical protein